MKNNITNKELLLLGVIAITVYFLILVITNNPLVLPEGGYCVEKNLPLSSTTFTDANGSRTNVEYCDLDSFCEAHYESTIVKGEGDYDEQAINDFVNAQESQGLSCFTDYAVTSKRDSWLPVTDSEELITKYACCNQVNLEADGCPGNTCEGKYTGYLDSDGCRVYANIVGYNADGYAMITTCGGDAYTINNQHLIKEN